MADIRNAKALELHSSSIIILFHHDMILTHRLLLEPQSFYSGAEAALIGGKVSCL